MPFLVKDKSSRTSAKKKTSTPTVSTIYPQGPSQSAWSITTPLPPYSPPHQPIQDPFLASSPTPWHSSPYGTPPPEFGPLPPFCPPITQSQPHICSQTPYIQHAAWNSCSNLATTAVIPANIRVNVTVQTSADCPTQGGVLSDIISSKLDDVISLIDDEIFTGGEEELTIPYQEPIYPAPSSSTRELPAWSNEEVGIERKVAIRGGGQVFREKARRGANRAATHALMANTNHFAKANLYANSRLPANLPPLKVYIPTYPLMCLASQYSLRVYMKPKGKEKDTHVAASWRMGTKAMVIKSVPVDDMNTIVFAIRGTQTFFDWAVNLNTAPVSPKGFLDDPGNFCHAGFLEVAKKMVKPVAARLRQMLEENPSRASCALLITGHSAGGAVASLLFCHMLSETVNSELTPLTGCFKRVHCITFGAPPISLLPLSKPNNRERHLRKSLFFSFINEGDPVARADRPYVRSLLDLYSSPAPRPAMRLLPAPNGLSSTSKVDLTLNAISGKCAKTKRPKPPTQRSSADNKQQISNVIWPVPPTALSNAGRLVILRIPFASGRSTEANEDDVCAYTATDQQMRTVVFGDPLMHQMRLYAKRVEILATKAVTGRLFT